MSRLIIAVDFDGTIVSHEYPRIGTPSPGVFSWLKKLQEKGALLILLTMRCEDTLDAAVRYCKENGVEFWQVNDNKEQVTWTNSRKVYAHVYVDDAAIGTPMKKAGKHKVVNWSKVGPMLMKKLDER